MPHGGKHAGLRADTARARLCPAGGNVAIRRREQDGRPPSPTTRGNQCYGTRNHDPGSASLATFQQYPTRGKQEGGKPSRNIEQKWTQRALRSMPAISVHQVTALAPPNSHHNPRLDVYASKCAGVEPRARFNTRKATCSSPSAGLAQAVFDVRPTRRVEQVTVHAARNLPGKACSTTWTGVRGSARA